MKLVGNTALITGGARGLGYAMAERFSMHGCDIAIADINDKLGPDSAKKLSEKYGNKVIYIKVDVASLESVQKMWDKAVEELGSVYILCSNAGIDWPHLRTWEEPVEAWDKVMAIDLKGPFLCTKVAVPYWINSGIHGCIINTSSINYDSAVDGLSHYCAAKAGVSQLTKVVAAEAGRYGIRANAIAPGLMMTEMTAPFVIGKSKEEFFNRTPLYWGSDKARVGDPQDVAKVAAFLASDYAEWITGVTISVDGGNHIRGLHSYWDLDVETGVIKLDPNDSELTRNKK